MPRFNPRMSTLQNLDSFGLEARKQPGSELTREIYDEAGECVFVGTPWQIVTWLKAGAPRPDRAGDDSNRTTQQRKPR